MIKEAGAGAVIFTMPAGKCCPSGGPRGENVWITKH
jgi:hypothetical protein